MPENCLPTQQMHILTILPWYASGVFMSQGAVLQWHVWDQANSKVEVLQHVDRSRSQVHAKPFHPNSKVEVIQHVDRSRSQVHATPFHPYATHYNIPCTQCLAVVPKNKGQQLAVQLGCQDSFTKLLRGRGGGGVRANLEWRNVVQRKFGTNAYIPLKKIGTKLPDRGTTSNDP